MIRACPNCNAKNQLPTDGDANQLGRPVCASCGNHLFPENHENETSKQTTIATARNDFEKHFTLENFYD